MTEKDKHTRRLPDDRERSQRWISVYLAFNVRGHRTKLRGLVGESWHIGKHKPLSITELCLQIIRRICFFAQDTGFIKPGEDWVKIYRQLSEDTRSIAQYYADQRQAEEREG